MDRIGIIGISLFLCSLLSVARAQVTVTVKLSKATAQIGEDLEVVCKVSSENREDTSLVMWVKRIDRDEVPIGTNAFIEKGFMDTGRYAADIDDDYDYDNILKEKSSEVTYKLKIKDVKTEDSGEIGCRIPPQHVEVFESFTVYAPVQSVTLKSLDLEGTHAMVHADGQNVTFKEGEVRKFYCLVNGSYPLPKVKVFIGNKDITNMFTTNQKLAKDGKVVGLKRLSYDITLTNEALAIDYSYSRKKLKCKATVPKSGFRPKSQAIQIMLEGYSPKFLCNTTSRARLHQRNFLVKCLVRADPPVNDFKFMWQQIADVSNSNVSLEAGDSDGHYHSEIQNGTNEYENTMVLHIDRVFKQHFRKYIFEAENDLGRESHTVQLLRHDAYGSGAQPVILSCSLMILLTWIFSASL